MADNNIQPDIDNNVNSPKMLVTDKTGAEQPKGTYPFLLNGVKQTIDGNRDFVSNEPGNENLATIDTETIPLGKVYMGNNETAILHVSEDNSRSFIGIHKKDGHYETHVNSTVLGFKVTNQIQVEFRRRGGNDRTIYWVDGDNNPRQFNFDKPQDYYTSAYRDYLIAGGNPNTYALEKWNAQSFDLQKNYSSIPSFDSVDILDYGSIYPGSYNFAIQYMDEDLNPTEWITTTNIVKIFSDSRTKPYSRIHGSRNVENALQSFGKANKSIKLTLSNLDLNYPYYRIAIIQANQNTGSISKVIASEPTQINQTIFIYSGNDEQLTEIPLPDIVLEKANLQGADSIEQLENRLILANVKGERYNWCNFQSYASGIKPSLAKKDVALNDSNFETNTKNPMGSFVWRGSYMPGDVASFGAVYIMKDYSLSPVFHIPGPADIPANHNGLKRYEVDNVFYRDTHDCQQGHWGKDTIGNNLTGQKVRHMLFPTRREEGDSLINMGGVLTSLDFNRLKFKIELAPSASYPVDGLGNPLIINFNARFHLTGGSSDSFYNGTITQSMMGTEVTVYDGQGVPDAIVGSTGGILTDFDAASQIMTGTYIPGTFIITWDIVETYVVNDDLQTISGKLYGIQFDNIVKPHPDVIGFYIVRNERTDTDKIVLDNALIGRMNTNGNYKSFSHFIPERTDKDVDKRASYIFSPEHQFFQKQHKFTEIEIQGYFEVKERFLPTFGRPGFTRNPFSHAHNFNHNTNPLIGTGGFNFPRTLYIQDVQAGTTYDPDIYKEEDNDGFDLAVGYRNQRMEYEMYAPGSEPTMPSIEDTSYLSAASNRIIGSDIYYNASPDNKIGVAHFNSDQDVTVYRNPSQADDCEAHINISDNTHSCYNYRVMYGTLKVDNKTAYSDFQSRPYYKEHNNPILFPVGVNTMGNIELYNGDAIISPINPVSTLYYDTQFGTHGGKKDKTWLIILGVVLVVVAIAVGLVTAGVGGIAVGAVAGAVLSAAAVVALSYGINMIMAGLKFEQMKKMIDEDYPNGLFETIQDGGTKDMLGGVPIDDMFRWWSGHVENIWIETTVDMALRANTTGAVTCFMDAPQPFAEEEFRSYLTDKLTVLDRDHQSGRLYKGFPSAEFYDMNLDYLRFNKEKSFYHLPPVFDCCNVGKRLVGRVHYSQQSFQEELIDNYRVFLPNNYRDIETEHGGITNLFRIGESLYIHTEEALYHLPQNIQERANSGLISFLGTGEFFSIPPRLILDGDLQLAGSRHKWATVKTPSGVVFLSDIEGKIYIFDGANCKAISGFGNEQLFRDKLPIQLNQQLITYNGIEFPYINNPSNERAVGIHAIYDPRFNRVLITKRDWSILNLNDAVPIESVGIDNAFTSASNYPVNKIILDDSLGIFVRIVTKGGAGPFNYTTNKVDFNNNEFQNHSWTISFDLDEKAWVGWHSYIPSFYFNNQDTFFSFQSSLPHIWKHNFGNFQEFYGVKKNHIVELVTTGNPLQSHITDSIQLHTIARRKDDNSDTWIDVNKTFSSFYAFNSRQCSIEHLLKDRDTYGNQSDWLGQQVDNDLGTTVLISRTERTWNINDLRDYVLDPAVPIFKKSWADIGNNYFIDKVINTTNVSLNKPWYDLQPFRDRYLVIRLIFDNFGDNINLITNYSVDQQTPSIR